MYILLWNGKVTHLLLVRNCNVRDQHKYIMCKKGKIGSLSIWNLWFTIRIFNFHLNWRKYFNVLPTDKRDSFWNNLIVFLVIRRVNILERRWVFDDITRDIIFDVSRCMDQDPHIVLLILHFFFFFIWKKYIQYSAIIHVWEVIHVCRYIKLM